MNVRKEFRINGKHCFVIDAVLQRNGTYHIYARLYPPDIHQRGAHHNHLLAGNQICVAAGREPRSAEAAVKIGRCWAEGWSKYITTGTFPSC
ncbi:MAG: hypothetical protein R3C01_02190 [Planctomycetaceae bacterium]